MTSDAPSSLFGQIRILLVILKPMSVPRQASRSIMNQHRNIVTPHERALHRVNTGSAARRPLVRPDGENPMCGFDA